jgi:hypothetical protein
MLDEGIILAGQPIPVGGGDRADAFDDLKVDASSLADRQL